MSKSLKLEIFAAVVAIIVAVASMSKAQPKDEVRSDAKVSQSTQGQK